MAWLDATVARRGIRSSPTGERRAQRAVAAVLRGGFSFPLPQLLHRAARREFSLLVGERERSSAGARGRCPSRRPTLSKPTQLDTHSAVYTSSRHDGGDTRFMLARVYARIQAHDAYGRRVPAATHARGPTTTTTRTKKTHPIVESYRRRNACLGSSRRIPVVNPRSGGAGNVATIDIDRAKFQSATPSLPPRAARARSCRV